MVVKQRACFLARTCANEPGNTQEPVEVAHTRARVLPRQTFLGVVPRVLPHVRGGRVLLKISKSFPTWGHKGADTGLQPELLKLKARFA